jgi:TrmH family RNA methyltransferase
MDSASLTPMSRVRVVLVRPQVAGNVGSIARIMENFAAGPLYLVQPEANHTSRDALARSTHGEHRLHEARVVSTIEEALEGAVYAIAASRRHGPSHQVPDLTPREMAGVVRERSAVGDVALVFGTEDNGLSREDLLACDAVVRIPSQPGYPTLNLAHAAVVCLYEVFLALVTDKPADYHPPTEVQPADSATLQRLMTKLQHALLTLGYLRPEKPDHLMFPIRAILSRAGLSRAEAQILMGLAQQIDEFAQYGPTRTGKQAKKS